jgi:hypothetical protein
MPDASLGLIMILKDEEQNLERSLGPLASLFDEVVAVDTGSSDATVEICTRLGAAVHHFEWIDDFSAARNFSIEKAQADWLFWLDGDNAIPPEGVAHLRASLPEEGPAILWATERVIPSGQELWQKRCFPNHPRVRFQGRVHEQLVHPKDWPAVFTQLVVEHWGYVDPQHVAQTGRYYLELLERMLAEDPKDFYSHFQAARCLINLRGFDKAHTHLESLINSRQARTKNPGLWVYGVMLKAQLLHNQGESEKALQLLDEVLEAQPELGLLHYQKGRVLYGLSQWDGAAKHLGQCIKLGLGAPVVDLDQKGLMFMAHYFLARALIKLDQPAEALDALEQAVRLNPSNLAARVDLARLLLAEGQKRAARGHLEFVLGQQPDDRTARRLLKSCEAA